MDGWKDGWMDGWMNGWVDGQTDGQTDGLDGCGIADRLMINGYYYNVTHSYTHTVCYTVPVRLSIGKKDQSTSGLLYC